MKYCIYTFGCKVNKYESEKIDYFLKEAGHQRVDNWIDADVLMVNGCVVTSKSETRNKRLIRKALRERPGIRIIAAGCLAEKGGLPDGVESVTNNDKISEILGKFGVLRRRPFGSFSGRNRAFIKIQEGCNQFCSYCIIPYVRGRERDMPIDEVLDEARAMSDNGYKEIVLTGIHIGRNRALKEIIRRISSLENVRRIRLSSIEIREVDESLLRMMREDTKVMPHLHIPLQSGSTRTLKSMNRPYTAEEYLDAVLKIRESVPGIGLTTDLIVGFPGEREKDFEESLGMIGKAGFHRVHVFPFSPRPGTAAWGMDGTVDGEVMKERAKMAAWKAAESSGAYAGMMKGKVTEVLLEEAGKDSASGYSSEYLRTEIPGKYTNGEIITVKIGDMSEDGTCTGEDMAVAVRRNDE